MKFNCVKCNKEITQLYHDGEEKDDNFDSKMWSGGIVDKIAANYGSKHDSDMFYIGICDECINILGKQDKIIYSGNYMHSDDYFKEIEKKVHGKYVSWKFKQQEKIQLKKERTKKLEKILNKIEK